MNPEWTIHFTRNQYVEDVRGKHVEPVKRGLSFVLYRLDRKWHIKLTYRGNVKSAEDHAFAERPQRQKDFENVCLCIDFDQYQLLDNTVTELLLSQKNETHYQPLHLKRQLEPESEYAIIVDNLWCRVQEDPLRVRFPGYNARSSGVSTMRLSDIKMRQELSLGVHLVHVDNAEYVYKEINRPLYHPRDSDVMEQELRNLEQMRGNKHVVRLVAAVVSDNPYQTTVTEDHPFASLQGILLEYHSNGTLQDALGSRTSEVPWLRFALQLTHALHDLHLNNITHMDLKPSNIVLGKDLSAILIDISGIGGITPKWLSPEMILLNEPLCQGIEARKQHDIWALGRILLVASDVTRNAAEQEVLRNVALRATAEIPLRIPLQDIISALSLPASTSKVSDLVLLDDLGDEAAVHAGI